MNAKNPLITLVRFASGSETSAKLELEWPARVQATDDDVDFKTLANALLEDQREIDTTLMWGCAEYVEYHHKRDIMSINAILLEYDIKIGDMLLDRLEELGWCFYAFASTRRNGLHISIILPVSQPIAKDDYIRVVSCVAKEIHLPCLTIGAAGITFLVTPCKDAEVDYCPGTILDTDDVVADVRFAVAADYYAPLKSSKSYKKK